jgi:hypothetical protein
MIPLSRSTRVALVLTAFGAACAPRPSDGRIVLKNPQATLPGTFGQVTGIAELTDGRVAVADFGNRLFIFGDFDSAKLDSVGRHVDTLTEGESMVGLHKMPGVVVHLAGDTVALVDFAFQRATLWTEKGQSLGPVVTYPVAGYNPAVNFDTLGYAYKADYRAILGGEQPGIVSHSDSAPIVRFMRSGETGDTIGRLLLPRMGDAQFGNQTKSVPVVFAPSDVFGVTPDGWVWVARATTNSVDWRSPAGQWTQGKPREWKKIPVTDADKNRFMTAALHNGLNPKLVIIFPFAAEKPPFTSATTGQGGTVWLQRSREAADSVPVYDVLARDDSVVKVVQLPKGSGLGGVGRDGVVYVILRDGGKQKVARYQLPR